MATPDDVKTTPPLEYEEPPETGPEEPRGPDHADFPDEQLDALVRLMPNVMRALAHPFDADVADVYAQLDDYCWHWPPHSPGEECVNWRPR